MRSDRTGVSVRVGMLTERRSDQGEKLIDGQLRLLENVRERGAFDGPMRRHDDFERLVVRMLL